MLTIDARARTEAAIQIVEPISVWKLSPKKFAAAATVFTTIRRATAGISATTVKNVWSG
jgi:hypothetical protein